MTRVFTKEVTDLLRELIGDMAPEARSALRTEIFGAEASLTEARAQLQVKLKDGTRCPCCDQHAQIYRRIITSSMAYCMILITRYYDTMPGDGWLHVASFIAGQDQISGRTRAAIRGDFAKLLYWNLLEERPLTRPDGNGRAGYYRLTSTGKWFVDGSVRVPKVAVVYNGQCLRLDDSEGYITIHDALGKKFNWNNLMKGRT